MTTATISGNGFRRILRTIHIPPVYFFLILVFLAGGLLDQFFSDGQIFKNPAIMLNIVVRSVALGIVAVGLHAGVVLQAAGGKASREGNICLRDSLANARLRFERTKKGHVAFIGGSITEMEGYPRTVMFDTDLTPGPHTLVLRIRPKTEGSGHAVRIMQFVAN